MKVGDLLDKRCPDSKGARMRSYKVILAIAAAMSACAIDPASQNDYSGLGISPLSEQLRYSIFLGETTVDRAVSQMVNKPEIVNSQDPRVELEKIGFDCSFASAKACSYEGSAKSVIYSADRTRETKITTFIHIDAMPVKNFINIKSFIRRETI